MLLLLASAVFLSGPLIRFSWSWRSTNPVRRGVVLAARLGCFQCHGELGASGLPDPALGDGVPAWSGGVWMMYVRDEAEIHEFILDGTSARRARSPAATQERARAAIRMPGYRGIVNKRQLEELTAAFTVLSGMRGPPAESAARRGLELASSWKCFSCHGPGGSGGRPNPGSFSGFVPGWYGAEFTDMVRSREEFDSWVREGRIVRLSERFPARYFLRRQRLQMPRYSNFPDEELDALWAYVSWLAETQGGIRASNADD